MGIEPAPDFEKWTIKPPHPVTTMLLGIEAEMGILGPGIGESISFTAVGWDDRLDDEVPPCLD